MLGNELFLRLRLPLFSVPFSCIDRLCAFFVIFVRFVVG